MNLEQKLLFADHPELSREYVENNWHELESEARESQELERDDPEFAAYLKSYGK